MSTLAELRDRVESLLMDTSNLIWDTGTIDEAIRRQSARRGLTILVSWFPGTG